MYYIHDLYLNKFYALTQEQLVTWWKRKFPHMDTRFDQLNMTGNDTIACYENRVVHDKANGTDETVTERHEYLRRYMVTDDAGRAVDIRLWSDETWSYVPPKPVYSWGPYHSHGSHRVSGPSMKMGTLRMAQDEPDMDGHKPIVDRTGVRNKILMSPLDTMEYYDRRHAHGYYADKSWKAQTRGKRQYAKHNTHHRKYKPEPVNIFKILAIEGFPVSAAATCD